MPDLKALLERVEKCTGPDAALDNAIMHYFWGEASPWINPPDHVQSITPSLTTSLDSVLALVEEQMAEEWPAYEIHARMVRSGGEWWHFWEITVPSSEFQGRSKLATLALLSALLRALIAQQEKVSADA